MKSERLNALEEVQCADFALYEAALFLDVNNKDSKALKYFGHYSKIAREAREKYEARFGPLQHSSQNNTNCWKWTEGPWPWEYGDRRCE